MKKKKFVLTDIDPRLAELIPSTTQKTLAIWSRDCVERVLPYFVDKYPSDSRPQQALDTLQKWIDTGKFNMAVIRQASLSSHAAAREVGMDNPARSVARAAGQAVATAHVKTHSLGGALYALQAISRTKDISEIDKLLEKEREWQYQHLVTLRTKNTEENS